MPDADLFRVIKNGQAKKKKTAAAESALRSRLNHIIIYIYIWLRTASIVTDRIESFDARSIKLTSGASVAVRMQHNIFFLKKYKMYDFKILTF